MRAGSVEPSLTPDQQTQVKVLVPGNHLMVSLLGQRDELLRLVEGSFPVSIHVRGNEITVTGAEAEADRVARLFEEMVLLLEAGNTIDAENLGRTIDMVKADERPSDVLNTAVLRGRKTIRPKTAGQKRYVDAIGSQIITFGIGPAGTGKSYLAVALAVVLGVYPQGEKEVFRVTTQDGASTLASADHLWSVRTPSDRRREKPGRILTTSEMAGNLRSAHNHRFELPLLRRPAEFPRRDVPMDPYALGLLLRDGCLTGR